MFVELVQHHVGVRVPLEIDHEPHPLATAGVVLDVGDVLDPPRLHEVRDLLREPRLVHLIRQLGDRDPGPADAALLDRGQTPDLDRPPARLVGIPDAVLAQHDAAGWEIGSFHELPQLRDRRLGVVDEVDHRVDHLSEVVRRDVRRHPDGDAAGTVDQQVRESGRQHDGLLLVPVVVRDEIDRLRIDVTKQFERDRRQPRFRVAHGSRRIAVDRAEVAVRVDQWVAQRPVLCQSHEGVVHGLERVGVVLLHDLADGPGGLAVRPVRPQSPLEHRPEHPAVHRLQTVAHLGQRPTDDDGHRVVEVGALDLLFQLDRLDVPREQPFL